MLETRQGVEVSNWLNRPISSHWWWPDLFLNQSEYTVDVVFENFSVHYSGHLADRYEALSAIFVSLLPDEVDYRSDGSPQIVSNLEVRLYICIHRGNELNAFLADEGVACGLKQSHDICHDLASFMLYNIKIIIKFGGWL